MSTTNRRTKSNSSARSGVRGSPLPVRLVIVPTTSSIYQRDLARYRALSRRDPNADAWFVYAVTTTGVYCRPSCGARLPRPENTRYFANAAEAAKAGFRPCKRCRPEQPNTLQAERVRTARKLIEADATPVALSDLASRLGTSKYHLHRQFKKATGMTPRQYAAALRLERARRGLFEGEPVTEALYAAGYGSSGRFYAESGALGMPASSLARKGRGETIRSLVHTSSLGQVLIAATARGVCWVAFGESSQELEAELRGYFSEAQFAPSNRELKGYCRRVLSWIERGEIAADIPLHLVGTRFQLKVWEELQRLPPGRTTSYGELAKQLERPGAARAVGTAAGKNPVALLVPCHRLLRNDGGLGGYRWGVDRKQVLLEREAGTVDRKRRGS